VKSRRERYLALEPFDGNARRHFCRQHLDHYASVQRSLERQEDA
jgi:hypothetical protein